MDVMNLEVCGYDAVFWLQLKIIDEFGLISNV